MKKILIIQESLGGGGAEKVLCDVLNSFDYKKYDITLLLWHASGVYLDCIPKNVNIVSVFNRKHKFVEKFIFKTPFVFGNAIILNMLKRTGIFDMQFDVVISFLEGVSARIHSLFPLRSQKNISWVHSNMDKNRWSNKYYPYNKAEKFYNSIDDIVFVSNGARDLFLKLFNVGTDTHVIYNLQDPEIIRKLGDEPVDNQNADDRFIVCCAGRLVEQKRFDRVISIAEILKKRTCNVSFLVIGDGPLRESLETMAKKADVDDMVRFIGFDRNPYKYMAKSDMLLVTSQAEGYCLVVGEAMSLGLPILSTKVTGPMELLADNVGILCDEDVDELAGKIIMLYGDKDLRSHFSKLAYERSEKFSPENVMSSIYSLL